MKGKKGNERYLSYDRIGADLAARFQRAAFADPAAFHGGRWLDDNVVLQDDACRSSARVGARGCNIGTRETDHGFLGDYAALADGYGAVGGVDAGSVVDDGVGGDGDQVGARQYSSLSYDAC